MFLENFGGVFPLVPVSKNDRLVNSQVRCHQTLQTRFWHSAAVAQLRLVDVTERFNPNQGVYFNRTIALFEHTWDHGPEGARQDLKWVMGPTGQLKFTNSYNMNAWIPNSTNIFIFIRKIIHKLLRDETRGPQIFAT